MTEIGSDEKLERVADPAKVMAGVIDERLRNGAEEVRVRATPPAEDDTP